MQHANDTIKYIVSDDGTNIYASSIGDPLNSTLVFVHGYSSSAAVFSSIFANKDLSNKFYLIRYDTRGHGRSGKPNFAEAYSSERYAEDFLAVVKEFNAHNIIFVGWSMGGLVASDIIAHLPANTIVGAVYIASSPGLQTILRECITKAIGDIMATLSSDPLAFVNIPLVLNRLLLIRDPNPGENFIKETLEANQLGRNFEDDNPKISYEVRSALLGMAQQMIPAQREFVASHAVDETKIFEALKRGFPVLMIYGTHDAYMSGRKMVDILRPRCTNLNICEIKDGCHAPFLDDQEEVVKGIIQFVDSTTNFSKNLL